MMRGFREIGRKPEVIEKEVIDRVVDETVRIEAEKSKQYWNNLFREMEENQRRTELNVQPVVHVIM